MHPDVHFALEAQWAAAAAAALAALLLLPGPYARHAWLVHAALFASLMLPLLSAGVVQLSAGLETSFHEVVVVQGLLLLAQQVRRRARSCVH